MSKRDDKWYNLGQIDGKKWAASYLREEAAKNFTRGDDKAAMLLRGLANGITSHTDGCRAEYDKRYGEKP